MHYLVLIGGSARRSTDGVAGIIYVNAVVSTTSVAHRHNRRAVR